MALGALLLAAAFALPLSPAPAAPFAKILTDAPTIVDVAPGVKQGGYDMLTADGPLSVRVIAVDLTDPTVRVGTVLANDAFISSGEPVSSMARRTGAVAGINGDYFDINQTNQPLNILVQAGGWYTRRCSVGRSRLRPKKPCNSPNTPYPKAPCFRAERFR